MASTQNYKPSGKYGPLALPLLFVAAVGGGVLGGWLYFLTAQVVDLLIASQAGVGLIAGAALYAAVRLGKCRNPKITMMFGIAAAFVAYGTFLGFESSQWRAQVLEQLNAQPSKQAAAAQLLNPFNTLRFFLAERAESGVSLRPARSSYSSAPQGKQGDIRGAGYYLLLLFEFAVVAATSVGVAWTAANDVFCEKCNRWWRTRTALTVRPEAAKELVQLARAGDWQGVRNVKTGRLFSRKNQCEVKVTGCPKCGESEVQIVLTTNGAGQVVFQQAADAQIANQLLARR